MLITYRQEGIVTKLNWKSNRGATVCFGLYLILYIQLLWFKIYIHNIYKSEGVNIIKIRHTILFRNSLRSLYAKISNIFFFSLYFVVIKVHFEQIRCSLGSSTNRVIFTKPDYQLTCPLPLKSWKFSHIKKLKHCQPW